MILTRKIALGVAGVAAAGVLGTAGVAAATSNDSAPAPSASAAPSTSAAPTDHPKAHRARTLLGRGMHGEWVVKGKDGKPVTLETIRGTVTAVGSTSVTFKADDGFTETFATNSDTKVRGGADSLAGIKVGAKGAALGVKSGSTTTARVVRIRK